MPAPPDRHEQRHVGGVHRRLITTPYRTIFGLWTAVKFHRIYSGPNSDGAVSFEFYACSSSGQIVYALDNINNKLYKSTDYGASWANIGELAASRSHALRTASS
jgi:hypothetical protein